MMFLWDEHLWMCICGSIKFHFDTMACIGCGDEYNKSLFGIYPAGIGRNFYTSDHDHDYYPDYYPVDYWYVE